MAMNCKPVPTLDERINDIRMRTAEIQLRSLGGSLRITKNVKLLLHK
mgnify:CR=1 FL=1